MIIPLGDGLEMTEDKGRVPPGTLRDCLNYEIAYSSGYRRIDGFLRFDGQPESEDLEQHRLNVGPAPAGPPYGLHFFPDWVGSDPSLYGVVESVRLELDDRGNFPPANLGTRGQRAEIYASTPTGVPNAWILEPQANFSTDEEQADYIEVLTDSSISSGFIRAYTRVEIIDGQNLPEPDQDITISGGGWSATVRSTSVISGKETDGDLRAILWVELFGGSGGLSAGQELLLLSNSDRVGDAVSATGWSLEGAGGLVGEVVGRAGAPLDGNSGVLIRTGPTGWDPVEPAYEARFSQGTTQPGSIYGEAGEPTAPASANLPQQVSTVSNRLFNLGGGTSRDWSASTGTLVSAIQADDGEYALATLEASGERTYIFRAEDFGVSIDPLDQVTGFVVEIVAEAESPNDISLLSVDASTGGSRGAGTLITGKQSLSFGSPVDLWGASSSEALADALSSSGFRIQCEFASDDQDYPHEVRIHQIRLIVYFTGSNVDSQVFIRSGGTDYSARVLYAYVQDGDWEESDAEGFLTVARVNNPSLIQPGAEVRTESGGGGLLVATLDDKLSPIRLPSREKMNQRNSRFQFVTTNFFAAGRLIAAYGVSGAGPAFTFNREYLFRIRTGRAEDEPRHVARHADRLALGYENGDADFSRTGRPDLFDGTLDAFSLGFGQRITGMLPLTGGALGVWTEDSTHIVKGSALEQIQQQIISPSSGAVEYTVVDMGIPVFCDYRGINTLVASQRFGDFDMGRLSAPIRAWLLPRLTSLRSDGSNRPILAQPVQQKNQYRLWFADGAILTMTFLDDQQSRFTFQEWRIDGDTAKVICATNGLDAETSHTAFAAFEGSGYAYRLDHTDTFDGGPIDATLLLNPITANGPGRYQRLNLTHVHGLAEGDFSLKSQIGIDNREPTAQTSTCLIKEGWRSFAKFRHKARGREFTIKLTTEGAPIHTLQMLELPNLSERNPDR